jgi:BON domain
MKYTTVLAAILVIGGLLTGCQTLTGKTAKQDLDDKWMSREAKFRIAAAKLRNLTAVHVHANRGTLYLNGNVATPEDKVKAERIAWDVDGVHDVVNNLQVGTATTARRSTASQTTASTPATMAPSASPATNTMHTVTGEVVNVDRDTGRLTLKQGPDNLVFQLPPSAVQNIKRGDRVTVQLALSPAP